MKNSPVFIEIECSSKNKKGKITCGDVFLSRKIKEEERTIAVLSDGLGSGIKANILATMTANMAMNFTLHNQPVKRSALSIINTLPEDDVRKISYATFTIVDIAHDGATKIIEYGNPQFFILRNGNVITPEKNEEMGIPDLFSYKFQARLNDRIVLFSDGISQSGMGTAKMPFGWEDSGLKEFVKTAITIRPDMSAAKLSQRILAESLKNDAYTADDDMTCAVIYFRKPRKMMIVSGPPYTKDKDKLMAGMFDEFQGTKIVCGGTTAKILGRELKREISVDINHIADDLPPIAQMQGADLITEGILTLGRLDLFLSNGCPENISPNNPAAMIFNHLMENDEIQFLIGTSINPSHQDPDLPQELEIRRNVIKKIAACLEDKYLKHVYISYL